VNSPIGVYVYGESSQQVCCLLLLLPKLTAPEHNRANWLLYWLLALAWLSPKSQPTGCCRAGRLLYFMADREAPLEMDETEKFMFDLQGFLVVPGFLTSLEVDRLNLAIDANWEMRRRGAEAHKRMGYDQFYGMLEWPQPHCQPFRELLAHRKLVPLLNTIFGRGWKNDHEPFMLTGTKAQSDAARAAVPQAGAVGGMTVHGGTARRPDGAFYYEYANGTIRCGMCNCMYLLRDIAPGDGGVGFVPGSHKVRLLHSDPRLPPRSTVVHRAAPLPYQG
jgi:hypothetical protein